VLRVTKTDRLFALLEERGVSQKELSEATGIKQQTISDWKSKGTFPRADKLDRICGFLKVSVQWLLTGEDGAPPVEKSVSDEALRLAEAFDELDGRGKGAVWGCLSDEQERIKSKR
jgi:transcriptional regulator with XRE-family HTH domain